LERVKNVVEGAGAVGIAALLSNKIRMPKKKIGVVLSGGNIDLGIMQSIIDRGLVRDGRRVEFNLLMKDKPGQLRGVTDILSTTSANIYSIKHDRVKDGVRHGYVNVNFVLEIKDSTHSARIFEKLRSEGYKVICT
jgi:threonine dehydratase